MTALPFVTPWSILSASTAMRPTARGGPRASRTNCATPTRVPDGASAGACTTVQRRWEDKERVTQDAVVSFGVLGHLWRTAGYHEVCAADEDGYDGGGRGEDWE